MHIQQTERSTERPTLQELTQIASEMVRFCTSHLNSNEQIVGSETSTGTIVTAADLNLSERYLTFASSQFPGSFSEEHDPKAPDGSLMRLQYSELLMFDPLDGTGDKKYGSPDTPSGMGYSSLVTVVNNNEAVGGVCIRPAHHEVLIFHEGEMHRYRITNQQSGILAKEPADAFLGTHLRKTNPNPNEIRVNNRPAYPDTNFPPEFFENVNEVAEGEFTFVPTEAGGAGDSLSRLMLGDLDLVYSGRKTDWKNWDTDLFKGAINQYGGRITDYSGKPLAGINNEDLWHTNGVLASICPPRVQELWIKAIQASEGLYYDPRE